MDCPKCGFQGWVQSVAEETKPDGCMILVLECPECAHTYRYETKKPPIQARPVDPNDERK